MNIHSETKTYIHEIGHEIEARNPKILEAIQDFFESRTKGLEAEWLGEGYKRSEWAWRDEFIAHYTGKPYTNYKVPKAQNLYKHADGVKNIRASEILTMGLQYMYEDPLQFAQRDFGHFLFILEIMQGRIPTKFYGAKIPAGYRL